MGTIVGQRTRDGCAVETRSLAAVLQEFVDEWTRQHPDLASPHVSAEGHRIAAPARRDGAGRYAGNEAVGAIVILHERTQLLVSYDGEAGVPVKTIRKILGLERRHTELRIADALVTAADRTHAFYDGSLRVVPNPLASSADRARCCAGAP